MSAPPVDLVTVGEPLPLDLAGRQVDREEPGRAAVTLEVPLEHVVALAAGIGNEVGPKPGCSAPGCPAPRTGSVGARSSSAFSVRLRHGLPRRCVSRRRRPQPHGKRTDPGQVVAPLSWAPVVIVPAWPESRGTGGTTGHPSWVLVSVGISRGGPPDGAAHPVGPGVTAESSGWGESRQFRKKVRTGRARSPEGQHRRPLTADANADRSPWNFQGFSRNGRAEADDPCEKSRTPWVLALPGGADIVWETRHASEGDAGWATIPQSTS